MALRFPTEWAVKGTRSYVGENPVGDVEINLRGVVLGNILDAIAQDHLELLGSVIEHWDLVPSDHLVSW